MKTSLLWTAKQLIKILQTDKKLVKILDNVEPIHQNVMEYWTIDQCIMPCYCRFFLIGRE